MGFSYFDTCECESKKIKHIFRVSEHVQYAEDEESFSLLVDSSRFMNLASRQVLFGKRKKISHIYWVVGGKLRSEIVDDFEAKSIEYFPLDMVGGNGFFSEWISNEVVFSVRNCTLIQVDFRKFEFFLSKNPKALFSIARKYGNNSRFDNVNDFKKRSRVFSLVPLSKGVDLKVFSKKMAASLAKFGKVDIVSKGDENAFSNLNGGFSNKKNNCIPSREVNDEFVLLEADGDASDWSMRCVEESDRVILVGDGRGSVDQTPVEGWLCSFGDRFKVPCELVLLHEGGLRPKGTACFKAARNVDRHHHVVDNNTADYDRIARIFTGNSIGFVLGGGGVRSISEIGFLKAVLDEGVPIDHVGGASVGAIIAALFATGMPVDAMESVIKDRISRKDFCVDYTIPHVSLVSGRKYAAFLEKIFDGISIEDMLIDFFCVATNLTHERLDVLDKGLAWMAVRASASLPIILPPIATSEGLLVDGGLLNNIPGDVMRDRGVGKVVILDASSGLKLNHDNELAKLMDRDATAPSAVKYLVNKAFRKETDYTKIYDIAARSMSVGGSQASRENKKNADIYIRLPVDGHGMLEFKSALDLIQMGYEFAKNNLDEWLPGLEILKR